MSTVRLESYSPSLHRLQRLPFEAIPLCEDLHVESTGEWPERLPHGPDGFEGAIFGLPDAAATFELVS
jgi:hypothetical protein